jgi:hypothetical protein
MYVFDNASSAVHEQDLAITENPVQTQASLSDHSYLIPARLSVQLLMSDAMQSYVIGQFSGTQSRSVSAYQVLLQLQKAQVPLQVSTRLRQYTNMLIASIRADEDSSTRYGGKFHVSFKEVLLASAEVTHSTIGSTSEYSADPQTTNTTILGQSQTAPVPDAMVGNNSVANLVATSSVSSAGTAAINGTSGVLPQEASDIITNAGGISSNINQLPAAITLVAKSSQLYYVAGATESIASLPATITSLARYVGAKVPPTTFTQVANLASVGATVEGSGSWSSNSVLATNAVLSGVNRF